MAARAIVYIYKPLAHTKENLEAAEYIAKQRAASLSATVVKTVWGLESWADPIAKLNEICEKSNAWLIVTPTLDHIRGDTDAAVKIADLATAQPPAHWPWQVPNELVATYVTKSRARR
ncbi:hypothetical protein HLB23_21990 [Nocardia uniformis]|uniref:Uncharacterized protein n=1 Tax=Nocardia uniformis TaxID=53432 RepID=A0A849C886_9NOCA|nr:hypothetical protein [Nocardia uniformis]NNH72495.1 hypothetical protein [Nocardia uniformis]